MDQLDRCMVVHQHGSKWQKNRSAAKPKGRADQNLSKLMFTAGRADELS